MYQRCCRWQIYYQTSTDNGLTWSDPVFLGSGYYPSIAASSGELVIAWYEHECFEAFRYCTADIWYATSADDGASWTAPERYTQYSGGDWTPSVAGLGDGGFALAWSSQRRRSSPQYTADTTVWFGELGVHEDLSPPPYVARLEHMPVANPQEGEEVTVLAWLADESAGVTSTVGWSSDAVEQTPVPMFDDGEHGDFGVGDGVFGGSLGSFSSGTHVVYRVQAEDSAGNVMTSYSRSFVVQPQWVRLNDVLLVVDARYDNRVIEHAPVYRDALNSLGVSHDFWDTSLLGPPDSDELAMYVDGLAVWSVPEWDGWLIDELTREQATGAVASYLDSGGRLFITGDEIGRRTSWTEWYKTYLHAEYHSCCYYQVEGVLGDPIGDGLAFSLWDGGHSIRLVHPALPVFRYGYAGAEPKPVPRVAAIEGDPSKSLASLDEEDLFNIFGVTGMLAPDLDDEAIRDALVTTGAVYAVPEAEPEVDSHVFDSALGLRVRTDTYRLVYFAFRFEAINSSVVRNEVMSRVLAFLTNPECHGLVSTMVGTTSTDLLVGTAGNDVIAGLGGFDVIFGLGGDDTICGGMQGDMIHGGDGNDWIGGFGGNDMINAGTGNDHVQGHRGHDFIYGGDGADLIRGGFGNDQVAGGIGDDSVVGGPGDDVLYGGEGADFIVGGPGLDTIDCGAGFDMARGGLGTDTATADCEFLTGVP